MREIVIISGKGGTGKTSLAACFAHLAKNKIICDLDVDTPDLHILLQPDHEREVEFWAGNEARIVHALVAAPVKRCAAMGPSAMMTMICTGSIRSAARDARSVSPFARNR